MTDLKISDGAVEAAARALCLSEDPNDDPDEAWTSERHYHPLTGQPLWRIFEDNAKDTLQAALTYYAAHPEELPQEVVDAVRGVDGAVKATDPGRKVGTAEVVNALAESSLFNNTDWD